MIVVDMVEGKKTGHLTLMVSPKRIQLSAQNFSARGIGGLFNQLLPECYINGDFTLSPQGEFFVGSGKYKIEKLVSLKSVIDIDLKQTFQNLQVQINIVSLKDNLKLEFSLPLSITRSLAFNLRDSSNMSATVKCITHIENILEFSDGVDVTGKIDIPKKYNFVSVSKIQYFIDKSLSDFINKYYLKKIDKDDLNKKDIDLFDEDEDKDSKFMKKKKYKKKK